MRKLIPALAVAIAAAVPVVSIAAAHTDTERFSLIDTSATAPNPAFSVIATGAFTDAGTATVPSKGVFVLHLSAGTITLHTEKKAAHNTKTQTATACMQTQTKHGGYTIAGGTGAYQGITGSGRAALVATFVEQARNGTCASSFTAVQAIVTASGPVTLS